MLGTFLGRFLEPSMCCAEDTRETIQHCNNGESCRPMELLEATANGSASAEQLVDARVLPRGVLPRGPRDRAMAIPTYTTTNHVILNGEPIKKGELLKLEIGKAVHKATLSLYANGFGLTPVKGSGDTDFTIMSQVWSPFCLVEKCNVKASEQSQLWAVFKFTTFHVETADTFLYFATCGKTAHEDRDAWLYDISNILGKAIGSLFPPHAITVQPVPWEPLTMTRIMAGYLLKQRPGEQVALVYAELRAYSGGEARLSVYSDEWCEYEMEGIPLSENSVVSTRKGFFCAAFGVEDHRFCARTLEEKDLWLRAVANIKVKLMFDAPDPSRQELNVFRAAVLEKVDELAAGEPGQVSQSQEPAFPHLQQLKRIPDIMSPRGDLQSPEPVEEGPKQKPQNMVVVVGDEASTQLVTDAAAEDDSWII